VSDGTRTRDIQDHNYQIAAAERDAAIAEKLSELAAIRELFHLGVRSVLLNRFDAFVGVRLCRVGLTGDDYLAVRGLQMEVELTALVPGEAESVSDPPQSHMTPGPSPRSLTFATASVSASIT
jgi:hypothetical protein